MNFERKNGFLGAKMPSLILFKTMPRFNFLYLHCNWRDYIPLIVKKRNQINLKKDMKKTTFVLFSLAAVVTLTGCKSRESAFAQAYQQALNEENNRTVAVTEPVQPVITETVQPVVAVQPVQPVQQQEEEVDLSDVRTIDGSLDVVSGDALRTYSVVVGSFITKSNADGLMAQLRGSGYDARVVRTNETINGRTGWYRVIASSSDVKSEAARTRDALKGKYPGAWLLLKR